MNGLGRRPDGENRDEPEGTATSGSAGAGEGKELKVVDAASLMGVSYRQAKRLWKRYREEGAEGLKHGSAGRRVHEPSRRNFVGGC